MKVLSWENSDRLFWLGRYTERAYSSIKFFADKFDSMIDLNNCEYMEQFANQACFSEDDHDSIYSNLMRAYDNAIMLRDEIGSETLCYVQLAVYALNKARQSDAPILALQRVTDNIVAFWGMVDDSVDEPNVRSIVKLGKRIERIDNYAKLKMNAEEIRREMKRLNIRIERTGLNYDAQKLFHLNLLMNAEELDYDMIVQEIESLVLNERQYFAHASGL
ncbi:MAG: alpha-E domain-containing protein [Treponema sp.]|nr:alpha-E domain-containing protein [Treponema sp.]